MESFVLVGKAKDVFRLLELKEKYQEAKKHDKRQDTSNEKKQK